MIEVKHIDKSFGDKAVLRDINAVFDDGKTNLIIGQSGAGKTVLMKILVGLLDPTGGEVLYDGRDFVRMSKRERVQMRREMGMIFQSAALFDSLSVLENVRFPKYLFCDEPNSGLDPKTSLVIDELLSGITKEYGITTIINTHDMNSVMGIGENIVFIADGRKEWQGDKDSVISSRNKKLNDLVFASDLFKKVREVEREEK